MSFESYETDAETTDFTLKALFGKLEGDWSATETIHKSKFCPQRMTSQGKTSFELQLNGTIAVSDHAQSMNGQVFFAQHAVFRRDKAGTIILYSFDSGDAPPDEFRGTLRAGVMRLECENAGGTWRMWIDLNGLDDAEPSYKTLSQFLSDGVWATNTEATYTRAG